MGATGKGPNEWRDDARGAQAGIGGFRVEGLVDGRAVTAVLVGECLRCDPMLLARAEAVVRLGETFGGGDVPCVRASLTDGPTAMLLTFLRAMSVVQKVEIMPSSASERAARASDLSVRLLRLSG